MDMKTEILHFTEAPEIQHFAMEKVNKNDNVYGVTWGNLVREYLKTAYSSENTQAEVVSYGITYKVLKRGEVTAFYDAAGNTLFDVENTRLAKEYEWVMNDSAKADVDLTKSDEEKVDTGNEENVETNEAPTLTTENVAAIEEENSKSAKSRAKEKLEKEMKAAKDKSFAEAVIGYLLKRCEEDEGLAQDVVQEHKTWEKCFDYIYKKARKQTKGNCAAVRDDVVYEWAEEYYHKDDKAEEEKKAKEAAERKKKQEERAKKIKSEPQKAETPKTKEEAKPNTNSKEMEGQLDMFSLMGM